MKYSDLNFYKKDNFLDKHFKQVIFKMIEMIHDIV